MLFFATFSLYLKGLLIYSFLLWFFYKENITSTELILWLLAIDHQQKMQNIHRTVGGNKTGRLLKMLKILAEESEMQRNLGKVYYQMLSDTRRADKDSENRILFL